MEYLCQQGDLRIGDIMNFSDAFLMLLQQTSVEKPSLFPFPFSMHLALVCIGAAFFVYRYTVQKRPNQMLMAIAMIASMAVWLSESRVLYYVVGVMELVLLVSCFVTSLIFKPVDESEAESSDEKAAAEEKDAVSADEKADASDEEE